jgi:hypothetical protein
MIDCSHQRIRPALIAILALIPCLSAGPLTGQEPGPNSEKLPVAAIVTVYTKNSHADVIVGKILDGYQQDHGAGPGLRLVSLYTDQVPDNDLSREMANEHGFRISPSIDDALTLGTNRIQVAGVISIGEHGSYPLTELTGQMQYPRRRLFEEIVATFERCGSVVPVFNDKHLGYRWEDAKWMVGTARKHKFPLLAGSSLPVAWREPAVDFPVDSEIEAALTIGFGGLEAYGFHALESHQCLLERRKGGETGVTAVQGISADGIRQAEREGRWSSELFAAARRQMPGAPTDTADWKPTPNSAVYLIEHQDGLRSAVLMANGMANHFATAVKIKGRAEPVAVCFMLQESAPYAHFAYLLHAIDETIHRGKEVYPVERTLLTTGILDRVMLSLATKGQRYETPELVFPYQRANWPFANQWKPELKLPLFETNK